MLIFPTTILWVPFQYNLLVAVTVMVVVDDGRGGRMRLQAEFGWGWLAGRVRDWGVMLWIQWWWSWWSPGWSKTRPQAEFGWGWYAERAEGYPLVNLIVFAFVLNFCEFIIILYFINTPKITFIQQQTQRFIT